MNRHVITQAINATSAASLFSLAALVALIACVIAWRFMHPERYFSRA